MKKYRIIIFGGRDYDDYENVRTRTLHIIKNMDQKEIEFVSGGCDVPGKPTFTRPNGRIVYGADGLGERLAKELKLPCKLFDPDWRKHGKPAGPIRNRKMAEYATHGIGFWDRKSRGTKSMKELCESHKVETRIIYL